jgi:glycosyltransferase involved in cell wall biosynthesis
MIPVLGIPVLNRGDLLLRCVGSIDYPVGRIITVVNGDDESVAVAIEKLRANSGFDIRVLKPPTNLGVAASWNRILREDPEAPYWLLVGNDIRFAPGDLRKIDAFTSAHPDWALATTCHGYSLMAVTQAGLERVGSFDENFFPAYWEDIDHLRRVKLSGCGWGEVPDVHAVHGEAPGWGSSTLHSDPEVRQWVQETSEMNFDYLQRKWHCGPLDEPLAGTDPERGWRLPFDDPALSLKDWSVDRRMAAKNGNPLVSKPTCGGPGGSPWRRWLSYGYELNRKKKVRRFIVLLLRRFDLYPPGD